MQEKNEAPHISVNSQYIKDLSFENPGVPWSLGSKETPQVDLGLDMTITKLDEEGDVFEVALHIDATTAVDGKTLFIVELVYAGIFTLLNIAEEDQQVVLAVHCPAMIFPFARKIVADVSKDGGYQALMIDPIDFGTLYYNKMTKGSKSN